MNIKQILLGIKIYSEKGMFFMLDKEEQLLLLEYINNIEKENEKLNHYKLLYQKVKDRNYKAIEYVNKNGEKQYNHHDNYRGKWYSPDELDALLDILKGNIEEVSNEIN